MKISILTATYNRENLLIRLYESMIKNKKSEIDIEWIIVDDGSTDNTKQKIDSFIKEDKIEIKYIFQENQGKMQAINNIVNLAKGDLIIECDSDDYFTENAFDIIKNEYEKIQIEGIYALCFLKYDQTGKNMGKAFKKDISTMFDLYFKQGENGEKALVYKTEIRKQYKYEIEEGERFVTEARMFHKMDEKYKIVCINKPIMVCEYQNEGYTKNIEKQFKQNPHGYFMYFQEILQKDMKGVKFKKRLYAIKHYILFAVLSEQKNIVKQIKGLINKILVILLYIPGKKLTKKRFY